jgi:protein-tyrosine phosphatase
MVRLFEYIFVMNILFVCTANICRSVMAERILKKLLSDSQGKHTVFVASAGVDALVDCTPDRYTVEVCRGLGVEISSHTARHVTKEMLLEAVLVLCLQRVHQQRIIGAFPKFTLKIILGRSI